MILTAEARVTYASIMFMKEREGQKEMTKGKEKNGSEKSEIKRKEEVLKSLRKQKQNRLAILQNSTQNSV